MVTRGHGQDVVSQKKLGGIKNLKNGRILTIWKVASEKCLRSH